MNKSFKIVLIVVAVVVVGGIIWLVSAQKKTAAPTATHTQTTTTQATPTNTLSPAQITQNYQQQLPTILANFSSQYQKLTSDSDRAKLADTTKAKVIALTVPVESKDLDLALVLALSHMSSGNMADGAKEYNNAIQSYSWLSSGKLP